MRERLERFLDLLAEVSRRRMMKRLTLECPRVRTEMRVSRWRSGESEPAEDDVREVCAWAEQRLAAAPGLAERVLHGAGWQPYARQRSRLREERETLGMTQTEAARRCGVSRQTYCGWECGPDDQAKLDRFRNPPARAR